MAADRVILHSDCNSFYASVELLYHPELRGRPVSVGGDVEERHGIILASSPEAKKFGVKTGEALWQAQKKCPELVIIPPNYERYVSYSKMTRQIYLDYTDRVEPFGLDECWLDVTGDDGMRTAEKIRRRIKSEIGITVSVGVSFNKVFAKLGSDYKKPDAITNISRGNFKELIYELPASDLLYVGRATNRKLSEMGIHTIGQLAEFPKELLCAKFGKWGEVLKTFACGADTSEVEYYVNERDVKSVGNSTTTPRDLNNEEDVKIVFLVLAESVSRRLCERGLVGRVVTISVRSSRLYWFTRQRKIKKHTSLISDIMSTAMELFRENYSWNEPIRSLGISVSDLAQEAQVRQYTLFTDEERHYKRECLEKASLDIKRRFGTYCVRPAILLKDKYLSGFDPKNDHVAHPVGFFKEAIDIKEPPE